MSETLFVVTGGGTGCLGGAVGGAPSIGRALRLVMRNVAGQRIDETSQSVLGTPGWAAGHHEHP